MLCVRRFVDKTRASVCGTGDRQSVAREGGRAALGKSEQSMDALAGYGSSEDSEVDGDAQQLQAGSLSPTSSYVFSASLHVISDVPKAPARPAPNSATMPASPVPLPSAALLFSSSAPSRCAAKQLRPSGCKHA